MKLNKKGQALIEFVIILPIFLFMLFAIIDFGIISYNKSKLESIINDVGNMFKNNETLEEINAFVNRNDKDIKVSIKKEEKYFVLTLTKDYEFVTPGMETALKDFKIDVERVMYNE